MAVFTEEEDKILDNVRDMKYKLAEELYDQRNNPKAARLFVEVANSLETGINSKANTKLKDKELDANKQTQVNMIELLKTISRNPVEYLENIPTEASVENTRGLAVIPDDIVEGELVIGEDMSVDKEHILISAGVGVKK